MNEHQEWVIAWLAAGGLFFTIVQIIKWIYLIFTKHGDYNK